MPDSLSRQRVSPIDSRPFAGRPAARFRVDVPDYPSSGQPMTTFALSVAGEHDLHLILVWISGPLSPADEAFAQAVLNSATWCPAGSTVEICAPKQD